MNATSRRELICGVSVYWEVTGQIGVAPLQSLRQRVSNSPMAML